MTDIRDDLPASGEEQTAPAGQEQPADPAPEPAPEAAAAETSAEAAEDAGGRADGKEKESGFKGFGKNARELKAAKEKMEALEKELAETKDHLLRQAAEYDNFRKRTTRERAEIFPMATAQTVAQFLPVLDNFERAMEACQGAGGEEFRKGFELIGRQFHEALEHLGVEAIDPTGEPFDPETCNAVMHVEDESVGADTVVEVFQKGYKLGDRIVRYAMVKVAN